MDPTRRQFLIESTITAALAVAPVAAQDQALLRRQWSAKWISVPGAHPTEYGVYRFRRTIELPAKPERFVVHVSGDNRYQLFVNGRRVSWGPARGDLFQWRYETVDAAPFLNAGKNILAAVVWNFGDLAPEAQITLETGFVLQGDTAAERVADTGTQWKCVRDESYAPLPASDVHAYYVVGPGDAVNGATHRWGWEGLDYDDSNWPAAVVVSPAAGREARDVHSRWMLVARNIPPMEERPERLQSVRRITGITQPPNFPAQAQPFQVPAHTHATLLLDQSYLTTAYPELIVSGGKNAVVKLGYAEALFESPSGGRGAMIKGNRNEIDGKRFIGSHDRFVNDGGQRRTFRPLWWRAYRYLELDVETQDEPLTVEDLRAIYIGFPFVRRAQFEAGAPELNRILDVGWRTARLCAHETYMDCPYYEQLQYVGDTRVQCLVSLFNAGDARLMRNAIDHINDSRQSSDCTMSRYPTRTEQFIPGFSLWWIGMVHDYWWYADDPDFVRAMTPGVRAVISFFENYRQSDGSLRPLPWWRYFDWVPSWPNGEAPQEVDAPAPNNSSAIFDLHLLLAYQWAIDLESALGVRAMSDYYRERERQLRETVQTLYWDAAKQLYADTPRKQQFSQHANTLAVLAGAIDGDPARNLMLRMLTAPGLAQPGLFFQFYVHAALAKVGEGNRYLDQLTPWRDMLARGLTTFAETVDGPASSSRSDCHAWSASPNIHLFRTVLGIDSGAAGFRRVSVHPNLGKLQSISGTVPHPRGSIEMRLDPRSSGFEASIALPPGVTGQFEWRGVRRDLQPGMNRFPVA